MIIECEGFILRIVSGEEYLDYFKLVSKDRNRLNEYFPKTNKATKNIEDCKQYIYLLCEKYRRKEAYPFGVFVGDQYIGWIGIKNIDWNIPIGELAYYIDEDFAGKGIITAGVNAVVKFAFGSLEIEKLFIRTGPANIASQRIALKNGFKKEGVHRNEFRKGNGDLEDTVYFGRLKSDN